MFYVSARPVPIGTQHAQYLPRRNAAEPPQKLRPFRVGVSRVIAQQYSELTALCKAFLNFAAGTFRISILRERFLELQKSFPSITLLPCATSVWTLSVLLPVVRRLRGCVSVG